MSGDLQRRWRPIRVDPNDFIPSGRYRIVHIDRRRGLIACFPLADVADGEVAGDLRSVDEHPPASGVPILYSLERFKEVARRNLVKKADFKLPPSFLLSEKELAERGWLARREANWNRIKDLFSKENEDALYDPELRIHLIKQQIKQQGRATDKTIKTIYRLLARCWHFGGAERSMTPTFAHCGAPGRSRGVTPKVKRGRKNRYMLTSHADEAKPGVNCEKDCQEKIQAVIDSFYVATRANLQKCFEMFTSQHFSTLATDPVTGKIEITPHPAHMRPTYDQFYRYANLHLERREVRKLLAGSTWNLQHRSLTSGVRHGVFGPCARYEIDATVADVWLVARFDRRQLIGRPIVYVVVDTWSRMIVGFHVALHGPSWETAILAIISAFTPKLPVLKALGFDDVDEGTWPASELCLELTSDRGEVFNKAVKKTLQSQLGVTSRVVGGSRGDAKAVVERKFGTLNTKLSWIPGAYMARMREADLEKRQNPFDARMDIDQFTAIIAEEILQCNNNTEYPELLLPEMRQTDMGEPTPRNMYLWGLEYRTGDKVPDRSTRELYILFLPRKMCSIARDGVTFRANQRYIPDNLLPEQVRRRPGATGSAGRVEVAYNPNSPRAVLVRDSDTGDWVDAVINPQDAKAIPGLTNDEIEDMLAGDALGALDRRDKHATSRHRTTRRQQGIIDRSIAAHNAAPPATSKAQIKRDTKSARAKEAESQRQQAHTNLSQSQPTFLPLPKASKPAGAVLPANKGSMRAKVLSFTLKRTRSRDGKDK